MTELNEALKDLAKNAAAKGADKETYTDAGGVERCAVCNMPVWSQVEIAGEVISVPAACVCDERAAAAREQAEKAAAAKANYAASRFYNPGYARCTFDGDSFPDCEASKLCRAFVEHWEQMEADNYGLLLLGSLGTGKSFYAAAVVNDLVEKGVNAVMVSASQLIGMTENGKRSQEVMEELNRARLVVLDDLGAERETDYALEQLELFIDARNLVGRPLIVTTNYSKQELDNLADRRKARIFDRVKAMCCMPVILTGKSHRADNAVERARKCKELLGV